MSDLIIIEQREVLGKDFKIYGDSENPLFLAKDVAEWIEYDISSVNKMLAAVDEQEKTTRKISPNGTNYQTEAWFLTEDGLYEVLMQSRKPIAKVFKREVKEILKSIRKRGIYATAETVEAMLNDPDTVIMILTELKAEREKRARLETRVGEMRPKEIFADAVTASKTTILVGELAKILKQNGVEIGQNRLFEWLRVNGFLINRRGTDHNMPTQYSMERGLFEIKETSITHSDGHVTISKTPKVTGKGQLYFVNKIKSEWAKKPPTQNTGSSC